jgi:hypothetical protein
MENYHELDGDTISMFMEIIGKKSFSVDIKFEFVGSIKQKELIKVTKIPDQYAFLLGKELLVSMNEQMINSFDEESIIILIEQEIDKITIDYNSGKIKLIRPDLTTFSSLVKTWGIEKVCRANQISELYAEQTEDANGELI